MKYVAALNSLPVPPSSESATRAFSSEIETVERYFAVWQRDLRSPDRLDRMDILRWIAAANEAGERDEALWRAFIAAHFGRASADRNNSAEKLSAGRFLCGFGPEPVWTWAKVSEDPFALRDWLHVSARRLSVLKFGNHRKMRAKKPDLLFRVFESFLEWVEQHGGTPERAFKTTTSNPESRFDELYPKLHGLHDFGRTGAYDFLCLLGDLKLLDVSPSSCYLQGATGPLKGAKKLWGNRSAGELTRLADDTARRLGVPIEVLEDALCNWQK